MNIFFTIGITIFVSAITLFCSILLIAVHGGLLRNIKEKIKDQDWSELILPSFLFVLLLSFDFILFGAAYHIWKGWE